MFFDLNSGADLFCSKPGNASCRMSTFCNERGCIVWLGELECGSTWNFGFTYLSHP